MNLCNKVIIGLLVGALGNALLARSVGLDGRLWGFTDCRLLVERLNSFVLKVVLCANILFRGVEMKASGEKCISRCSDVSFQNQIGNYV